MIIHQTESMDINKPLSFATFIPPLIQDIVRYRIRIIENKQIMDESNSVLIVHNDISFINPAPNQMPKFHIFMLGHPVS